MTYLKTGLILALVTSVSGCYNIYNRNNDNVLVRGKDYNLNTGVERVDTTNTPRSADTSGSNEPI